VTLDAKSACAWSYLAGRLYLAGGEANEAAAAFETAAADGGAGCPLRPYARLREAQALVRSGRANEAIAALDGVGSDIAAQDEAQLTRADALVVEGDRRAAVAIWRSQLAAAPHGLRWVDSSIQLARALLDGVDGSPASNAREAFDRVTRVIVEAPSVADKVDAPAVRDRAAAVMGLRSAPKLDAEERARQARAWFDGSQPKRARELAEGVVREIAASDRERAAVACKAATIRAQATPRSRPEDGAQAWGVAIARCRDGDDDDARALALYQGGKASALARRFDEALARFAAVEKQFPTHRLADDARFHSALVIDDQGDHARSLAMLASIADAYPDGDMGRDALFRVALADMEAGDLAGARGILDRLLSSPPQTWSWGAASRAEYFRARVAQLAGEGDDARARYAAIVARRPLSYPMLLAFSRLKDLSEPFAIATLKEAIGNERGGPFLTGAHPELQSPAFERFEQLLEVGEIESARREAAAAGFTSEAIDSEVLWVVAWLFDRAGAPEIGHAFARARLTDYRGHWPSGRWRFAWEVAFPRPWPDLVTRESAASGIPAPLTWAIMREESAFDPDARSVANAVGLMQLMGPTAQKVAQGTAIGWDEEALRRPQTSIALGARLLSSLRTSFPGRPELAIAAYNGGPVSVRRWLAERGGDEIDVFVERIPFDETRNYVKRVLASEASYAFLYAPSSLDDLIAPLRGSVDPSRAPANAPAPLSVDASAPIAAATSARAAASTPTDGAQ
jgi:soluble lytic murein transglycosylase